MKLVSVHVRMFRNILDSSDVPIQPDVTCLVGKNESGKTTFLHALWRLNPARTAPQFSIPDHYPAWLEKRHRLEKKVLEDFEPIEATFDWEDSDREVIEDRFGAGVVPDKAKLVLKKTYVNKFVWRHGCDEKRAVGNIVTALALPPTLSTPLLAAATFEELSDKLEAETKTAAGTPDVVADLQRVRVRLSEVVDKGFVNALWALTLPLVPKFLYFANFSSLKYSSKIQRLLTAKDTELDESEATARSLLRLGGADGDYLMNPDYERRKRELENVSNALTEDVLKYWSQNKDLRVNPEITQRTEQRPDGTHAVLDELKLRIWDSRHSLSLPFTEHSAGFQWFFSFLASFSEFEYKDPPVVILLDEPAVGLHAKAQDDFLRFITERITKRCQVIYTTHSPFMVQPDHLERVRLVEDRGRESGAVVSSDVFRANDPDTLFPLQGALGYDLVQHLFVAKNNLVVEGTSDYTYLKIISDFLAAKPGRTSLDPKWSIVPVGGADSIPTFVALLRRHLAITVLVDSRKEGHQRLQRLAADGFLEKHRIILVGDILGQKAGDIEDLFVPDEYLSLYNKAFGLSVAAKDLVGSDPIVSRLARLAGVDRFDHGRPADVLLRERDSFLPKLSEETLQRFEKLFLRINATG